MKRIDLFQRRQEIAIRLTQLHEADMALINRTLSPPVGKGALAAYEKQGKKRDEERQRLRAELGKLLSSARRVQAPSTRRRTGRG